MDTCFATGAMLRSGSKYTPTPKVSRRLITAAWAICCSGSKNGIGIEMWSPHQKLSKFSRSPCSPMATRSSMVGNHGPSAGSLRRCMVLIPILSVDSNRRVMLLTRRCRAALRCAYSTQEDTRAPRRMRSTPWKHNPIDTSKSITSRRT